MSLSNLFQAKGESLVQTQPTPAGQTTQRPSSRRFQQLIYTYLSEVKGGLLLAALAVLGATVMELLAPWPLKIIFDHILLGQPLPAWMPVLPLFFEQQPVWSLLGTAALLGVIALLSGGFSYGQVYLTARIGYQLIYRLRTELFAHLQRLSLAYHYRSRRGELLTKVASDTATLKELFSGIAIEFLSEVLTFIGMFVVMFWLNWQLSLVIWLSFPILFVLFWQLQSRLKESVRRQRKNEGKIASQLTEVLTGMLLVQAFGREEYEAQRFRDENAENLEEGIRLARLDAAVSRSVTIISNVALAVVIILGGLQALQGQLTPGDLLIFSSYVKSIYKPIGKVAKLFNKLAKAGVSSQRIAEILNIEPDIQDAPNAIVAHHLRGDIVFDHVTFAYDDGRPILRDISFRLRPGERLALVGASGAGKSTIASLILRLYDPQQGAIYIDGVNIKEYQRHSLRQQIGLVLQESFLFGATIRENISYGNPDTRMAEIVAAAQLANAHDFIMALPQGYETPIGEMGSTLSGGQRQRIAIARALLKQPSMLILDEPTSALDAASKALVEETLNDLRHQKSMLVIAHNLATIQNFDQILVLREGQIVEHGRHAQLMAMKGHYAELFHLQETRVEVTVPGLVATT